MEKNVSQVTAQEETALKARGYNEDLLPSSPKQRTMGARNFFTLWMQMPLPPSPHRRRFSAQSLHRSPQDRKSTRLNSSH